MTTLVGRLVPHVPTNDVISKDDIVRVQEQTKRVLDEIAVDRRPLMSAELIKGVMFTAGSNTIYHNLGRTPSGWAVVRGGIVGVMIENSFDSTKLVITTSFTSTTPFVLLVF